ncbi:MAG: asparaginase [Firmicutes bacterium]|nr:asparaginase [Bacillota bacterium]
MKTAVIFTGGTIASVIRGGLIGVSGRQKYKILECVPNVDVDIFEPYTILSENLDAEHIAALIECISKVNGGYDGIIVCHGTDTLQYGACAAAYALGSDTAPIVFVSSNYILDDNRANGFDNFKAAYDFIKSRCGLGVFIAYKNSGEDPKIPRASRAAAHMQYSDKIISIGGEYGEYADGVFRKNPNYTEIPDETAPLGACSLTAASALKLTAYPNMPIPDTSAPILLEAYHSGTAAQSVIENSNSRIYITGVEDRIQYESTRVFSRPNITVLRRAAAPAMYMKLWMCECAGRTGDMNLTLASDFAD